MSDNNQPSRKSNWGRWGDDDERGALNLLNPDVVLAGLSAATTGKIYSLGLPIQREGSAPIYGFRNPPQRLTSTNPGDPDDLVKFGAAPGVGSNEDVLILDSHGLSHMDALSHVYADGSIYNGFSTDTIRTSTGASRCGIDKVGGIATRAVVLDMARYFDVEWVEPGYAITSDDLAGAAATQAIAVRPGNVLLVRTGFLDFWHSQKRTTNFLSQPGLGLDAVPFIRENDVVGVGMDNSAIEPIPFDRGVFLGVHLELLVQLGVYLFEHLNLNELAADRVSECFIVIAPLLVSGASGSPINPIAIA